MKTLAGDPQLWKAAFYDRFVRPRASRIRGIRDQGISAKSLYYSSKVSKWLDDDHLVKQGKATNWKRQYRLRHNWSRGSASVRETQVAEQPSTPPLLLRLHQDLVVIADATAGLRAWSLKGQNRLIAIATLGTVGPTSMAVDDTETVNGGVNISIGFSDGSLAIYTLNKTAKTFTLQYKHAPSSNGAILAIDYASPYLLTMTGIPLLSLYRLSHNEGGFLDTTLGAPNLLSSLQSHTAYPPISLAIRPSSTSIVASIAYAMPTWTSGWSVGLQEIRLTVEGAIVDSRVASASTKSMRPPYPPFNMKNPAPGIGDGTPWVPDTVGYIRIPSLTRPTSLSYNHPYLLSAHADNTLTLYMVTSNAQELSIGAANRLWGHTSSVSGAHVGDRGKAVSVSAVGNELRVWELEGGLSSSTSRRRAAAGAASVQVRPESSFITEPKLQEAIRSLGSATPHPLDQDRKLDPSNVTEGWVAFDEERVVLLREKMQGAQALVVYDFS